MMRRTELWMIGVVILIAAGLIFVAQGVFAWHDTAPTDPLALPQVVISYQGTLADDNGNPIDTTVSMQFAIYDAPSEGNLMWGPETQSVGVDTGLFHVLLGSVVPINPVELDGALFLGIKVNGEEMSPRELIASAAYAMEARHLVTKDTPDVTATSGGIEITDIDGYTLRMDGNEIDATGGLHVQRNHSGQDVVLYSNLNMTGKKLVNTAQVGIGTSYPQHGKLMINTNAVPLALKETDTTGAGSLWRIPLDAKRLRFDASQNGTDFSSFETPLSLYPDGSLGCGAITENNLQTEEERAAGRSDRFEEGDVLCWAGERLEKCAIANDRLVQAVADKSGRPIVIGAEPVKVLGPVRYGDILVASDLPGYAMVNNDPEAGAVIGQALEDFDGEQGIIKAMIRKF